MKKNKLNLGILLCGIAVLSSCDSHDDECHECHIAFDTPNGEIEVPIYNAAGGEEFCGAELEEAEGGDFEYVLTDDYIVGGDTVPSGTYTEIHCEAHAH